MAALLLIAGLWLSFLTRFSVVTVLTEGQTFSSSQRQSNPGSLYTGRFAAVPDLEIKLEKLNPEFSSDGKDIKGLNGKIVYYSRQAQSKSEHDLTIGIPVLIDGAWIKLDDFGYSPRYVLKSKEGRNLDSSFIYMRLFPPGSEDSFRLLSPLIYYVRYYPAGKGEGTDPVIRLRIVRNKDIVFNDDVKLSKDVLYENSRIAIEEVRMWTKLSITRDRGQVIAVIGIITGLLTLVADLIRWRKGKA
jgi:cytochrome c biogenesis protein ResB